jgi:2-polyprenyl-3-methyl-5-hydroxy-6-metoxy-1,4-benzoquinol methylase
MRRTVARASVIASNRGRKLLSALRPHQPLSGGADLLDAQYAGEQWDYLGSINEAPRFGIVAAYCRTLAPAGSLLEIGCGEGLLVQHLGRDGFRAYAGVDISAVAISRAVRFADANTTFLAADAETCVPDGTFDVVVFNEILEYFQDALALVRRYERYLEPDGHFVVSLYDEPFTVRTRRIWRTLSAHYDVVAKARVRTRRDYVWNVQVLRPAGPSPPRGLPQRLASCVSGLVRNVRRSDPPTER